MIWLVWASSFVIQLHYLEANTWVNLSWPLFLTLTLVLAKYLNGYKLTWGVILFGVIADLSSHLPRGEIFGGYLILLIGVWVIGLLQQKYGDRFMQWIWLMSALVITLVYQLLINFEYLYWSYYTVTVILIWLIMATISLVLLDWAVFRLRQNSQNKPSEMYQ